jgi:AraC-like DNA-binding protein
MAKGHIHRFTEPTEFATALAGVKVDLTVLRGGQFASEITEIDVGALRIRRFSESLPRIIHIDHLGKEAKFVFHTRPGGPDLIRNGIEVTSEAIVRVGVRQSLFQRSSAPISWGSISLPLEDLPSLSEAFPECDLTPSPDEQIVKPQPGALANLQSVHAAAGSLARQAPELLDNCEVARGMEQILLQVLVACLERSEACEQTPSQRHHQKVMQRFHAFLEANPTTPFYLLEIARAVGASVRSLSQHCDEHLGMGAKKYLLLRRMHLARRALLMASSRVDTVTDVATQFGFWQFGRFSVQYRSLFGELPSETLRRDPLRTPPVSRLLH